MLTALAVLTASGWMLYYFGNNKTWRARIGVAHWSSGDAAHVPMAPLRARAGHKANGYLGSGFARKVNVQ